MPIGPLGRTNDGEARVSEQDDGGCGPVTAAVLLIGDELLSGRTKDKNFGYLAEFLTAMGITVCEARVVADDEAAIVAAVTALKDAYDYVFTSGGIGPTHDDITADAMARAFGVEIGYHPKAYEALEKSCKARNIPFTTARKRMARTPDGAELIENAVSVAPGFRIGNVFVMAGVPSVFQAMVDEIAPRLKSGAKMLSVSIPCPVGEGDVGDALGDIQAKHPDVSIGSYPYFTATGFGTNLVVRSIDQAALDAAAKDVRALVDRFTAKTD
jgi:molybdenum cofactor synthesis domain-containing protein